MICSFRVNEVRLDEVLTQVGNVDEFDVLVLDESGNDRNVTIKFAEKWGATSWRRELQCQLCGGPARVLRIAHGLAMCSRCYPVPTQHHRHKNGARWREEGALADVLIRSIAKSNTTTTHGTHRRLAARLMRATLAGAMQTIENANRTMAAIHALRGPDYGQ